MDRRSDGKTRTNDSRSAAAAPRIVLVTPVVEDANRFAGLLRTCGNADVAAVILRLSPAADAAQIIRIRAVKAALQQRDTILLLAGHANLVARTDAGGVHLEGPSLVDTARKALNAERAIGVSRLPSRHDAMISAERGADYVMFGEPDADGRRPGLDALVERIAWWSELFTTPCVAYAAALDEIDPFLEAGADFIALGEEAVWNAPDGPARALALAMVHFAVAEPTE